MKIKITKTVSYFYLCFSQDFWLSEELVEMQVIIGCLTGNEVDE